MIKVLTSAVTNMMVHRLGLMMETSSPPAMRIVRPSIM
jgi:hypothetical protein